jgi:hypothetical protein
MTSRRLIPISGAGLQVLLALVLALSSLSASTGAVQAASPGISIVSVAPDVSVTVLTSNFPANQLFNVRMGDAASLGVNGTIVATTNSGAGGSFQATYNIPEHLKGMARISIRMESEKGFYAYNYFDNRTGGTTTTTTSSSGSAIIPGIEIPQVNVTPIAGYSGVPTIAITSVQQDASVKILTHNFPPNQLFTVKMGGTGDQGANGVIVNTTNSGAGGSFAETYMIPDSLKGADQIAVRMECPAGYVAYNIFRNTATQAVYSSGTSTSSGYKGIPTFYITEVTPNATVSIQTNNFPLNKDFTVRMGAYGTMGVGGMIVATTNSGGTGSFTASYEIPPALRYDGQIAIRLESTDGYYAYNWFGNFAPAPTLAPVSTATSASTPAAGETPAPAQPTAVPTPVLPAYTGVPSFTIQTVIKDTSVTIQAVNFPPNQTFKVLMGAYGTQAVGGTLVTTTTSDGGGSFISTYEIPPALRGVHQIAMRMESPSGYFAYNYFFNISTP